MTTVTTIVSPTTLDEKLPAVYEQEIRIPQREQSLDVPCRLAHSSQAPVSPAQTTTTQSALLLHAAREPYSLVTNHAIPSILNDDEILVKVVAIGLNPIDWKGPAYNFGIPSLPWINGRDLAGVVVHAPGKNSRVREGDLVLVPSTDYRDIRKAAFQEYAVTTHFNAARIPSTRSTHASASVGVAYVASVLALGISFGLDFGVISACPGPDLSSVLDGVDAATIPADIKDECFASRAKAERPKAGDWVAIWGASTTTGFITLQLARMAGLKVICVADIARHGAKLLDAGATVLVDRHDTARAVEIIRGVTGGKLRYAIDIVGSQTATLLQSVLDTSIGEDGSHAHLLGLTGLPKERDANIIYHTVPIKLFHSSPEIGEAMVSWLERLLETGALELPDIIHAEGGLERINDSLEILRRGDASGKRIVVSLE